MKKLFLILLTLLAMAACTSEFDKMLNDAGRAGRAGDGAVFYATIEDTGAAGTQTKVYADEQLRVLWNADDMISIFDKKTANLKYQFSGEDGDNAGTFTKVSESAATGSDLPYVYAIYPFKEATSISGDGEISFLLPSMQRYKANSFGPEVNTMVSVSEGNNLLFKNVGGYLSFKLYGSDVKVKSITLRGNNEEKLAGAALISMPYGGTPTVTMQESATDYVTLTCETPVTLGPTAEEYTEFWFVLPPTNFTKGFTIAVTDALGGSFTKSTANSVSVNRNTLSRMATMEVVPSTPVPPDNEIWYATSDNTLLDLDGASSYNAKPFDVNVVSHIYENGKGIIVCDGPIKVINDHVFRYSFPYGSRYITSLFLPNSVEELRTGALYNLGLKELRLPDNLRYVGPYALNNPTMERFEGRNTSDDGRCVILEDGLMPDLGSTIIPTKNYLAAFAPSGLREYTVPSQTEILGYYAFSWCLELKIIHFNEGLRVITADCFCGDVLDCDIVFPSTLESMNSAFHDCAGIKGFYGNEKFHSADHMCLINEDNWLTRFVGTDYVNYSIPEGVQYMVSYAFDNLPNLETVTFPSSMIYVAPFAFRDCDNLRAVYGPCTSEDHKAIIVGDVFQNLAVRKGVKTYSVPEGIVSLNQWSFSDSPDLEDVYIPDTVIKLGGYDFADCPKLKKVVLSSNLKSIAGQNPFSGSSNLEAVYFRSYIPPIYNDTQFYETDCTHLTIFVPEETLYLYKNAPQWSQYAPYMVGYHYDDIGEWNPDYYLSSDLSHDGEAIEMQQSSICEGIYLVLMGDGFSDRQISDGTYDIVMRKAADAFFTEEPYKTYKNLFNVSYVNVVSMTEGYDHAGQALGTGFGSGSEVYGSDQKVIEYARKVVPDDRMDDALVIVMMNKDAYAGTCYMYDAPKGDYGRGLSIAYVPTSSDTDTFNGLVTHEAGGHGFAKLADEYAYEYMGAVPQSEINAANQRAVYGWWKNVDFTNDPTQVKWAQFITDSRYANEGIGVYEGAYTYWTGAWRPTENSIMRYNTGGFNAPSRYAIWYRIGKLAYGEDWNGSYEDFVTYDAVNRTSSGAANPKTKSRNYVEKQLPPLAPPVVVGHSWREELK